MALGSVSNKTISGYSIFGLGAVVGGYLFDKYVSREEFSGWRRAFHTISAGVWSGLAVTAVAVFFVNFIPTFIRGFKGAQVAKESVAKYLTVSFDRSARTLFGKLVYSSAHKTVSGYGLAALGFGTGAYLYNRYGDTEGKGWLSRTGYTLLAGTVGALFVTGSVAFL
jgi:hypothetical protein